jgi:hydroxymethylbilane synthase
MVPLRGNLDTRLRKLETMDLDGVILALAGLKRMGLEGRVTEILPVEVCLPAIGQGALGLETRQGDAFIAGHIWFLNDPDSAVTILSERSFLRRLEGGCQVPIAAFGRTEGSVLRLDGMVGTVDGRRLLKGSVEGPVEKAEALGIELAEILLRKGAREILEEVYGRPTPTISLDDRNNA